MNLKDIAAWMQSMNELTSGCVLELQADDRGGITLAMRWRSNQRDQWYKLVLSDIEIRHMSDTMQVSVLEQISHRVAESMSKLPNDGLSGADVAYDSAG